MREVGGICYYPTSGMPSCTSTPGAVRAWPRRPRSELALLFPDGKTKHQPADGGSLTRDDVRKARANKEVASQVAAYFELRSHPKSETEIAMAEAGAAPWAPTLRAPPTQVERPAPAPRVAAVETEVMDAAPIAAPAPKLVQAPRPAAPPPSDTERGQLNQLVTLAWLSPPDVPAQSHRRDTDPTSSISSSAPHRSKRWHRHRARPRRRSLSKSKRRSPRWIPASSIRASSSPPIRRPQPGHRRQSLTTTIPKTSGRSTG